MFYLGLYHDTILQLLAIEFELILAFLYFLHHKLAHLSMSSILEVGCTVKSERINDIVVQANFSENHASKVKSGAFDAA